MKRNTRNDLQNNSTDRTASRKGTPKFFKKLPTEVVEKLCIEFDAFPRRANEHHLRNFIGNNKKAVQGLSVVSLRGERFKLTHPVAGNFICTGQTFLDAISSVNTVQRAFAQ